MQPTISRRLRVPGDAELVEQGLQLRRRLSHVREVRTRLRIQVEPELVGVAASSARYGHTWKPRQPWLTAQATCARRRPQAPSRSSRSASRRSSSRATSAPTPGCASGRRRAHRLPPETAAGAPAARRSFFIERLGESQVVANEVELRLPALGETHLVRGGDPDLAAFDLEDLFARRSQPRRCYTVDLGLPHSRMTTQTRRRSLLDLAEHVGCGRVRPQLGLDRPRKHANYEGGTMRLDARP